MFIEYLAIAVDLSFTAVGSVHCRLTAHEARTACTSGSLACRVGASIRRETDQSVASTVVTADDIIVCNKSGIPFPVTGDEERLLYKKETAGLRCTVLRNTDGGPLQCLSYSIPSPGFLSTATLSKRCHALGKIPSPVHSFLLSESGV